MKIAIFADSYLPYLSGVTISVCTQFNALQALGHAVLLFAPDYPGSKPEKNIFRFPSIPSPYPAFRLTIPYALGFIKKFRRFAPEIIHSHSPFQLGHRSQKLAKEAGIPYVYTLHTLFEKYAHHVPFIHPRHISPRLRHHLEKFCAGCSHVVTPSPETQQYLQTLGVVSPSSVIQTGVDLAVAQPYRGQGVRKKYDIPEDAFVLLFTGRLAKEKNIPFLIGVLEKVAKEERNVRLMLVGSGPEKEPLAQKAAARGVSGKVVFAGEIHYPEIFNYYAAANLFVFASKTETQGLVIAEAKVKGLPAVAVDAEGVSSSIKNGEDGFLLPEDETLFAQTILSLIKNRPRLKQLGEAARFNGEQHLSAAAAAKKLEALYFSLLKK